MTVKNLKDAWETVRDIFPYEYEKDEIASQKAGYAIYKSTNCSEGWISDLGCRLEVNLPSGQTININIQENEENADKDPISPERRDTAKRLQRLCFWFTAHYVEELEKKKDEDRACVELKKNRENGSEVRFMILTAEQNAKVMLTSMEEIIHAVKILSDPQEEVEDWMIKGINAMIDKCNEDQIIPFDLPTSICGLLCASFR